MKKLLYYFKDPFKDLLNVKTLTVCSMLIALCVVSSFLSFYVTNALKFSLTFIFIAIIAMKFGPIIAAFSAALTDIIQFIAKPVGPYQPLLTLSCALTGIIFGLFLYKNKTNIWRIIVSKTIITVLISSLLDTYFISMLYGKVFTEFFIIRLPKNIILLPIEILILISIIRFINKNKLINK